MLDAISSVSRKAAARACKCVERKKEAIVALLNQVQHLNVSRMVPFRNGYDHGEVRFDETAARKIRLFVMRQQVLRKLGFFIGRQWRNHADFAQIDLDRIVIAFDAHVMDISYASNSAKSHT